MVFLVAADSFIRKTNSLREYKKNPPKYQGVEIEKSTRRICLMNTFLHGLDAEIIFGDALTDDVANLVPADIIFANPPFGAKAGSQRADRDDIPYPSTNKQFAFLQHIYLGLKKGGRAAVILPDNVLFEEGIGKSVRQQLMKVCNLHTVLRLPNGIFHGAGVKTNVLFFTKLGDQSNGTEEVWFYDMRTGAPPFGRNTPLTLEHFDEFRKLFGNDPNRRRVSKVAGESGRFRCFSIHELEERSFNLDINWLTADPRGNEDELTRPNDIADAIYGCLQSALAEIAALSEELMAGYEADDE